MARRLQMIFGKRHPSPCRKSYLWRQFVHQVASDGNIAGGLTLLFTTIRELNRTLDTTDARRHSHLWRVVEAAAADFLHISRDIIGMLQSPVEDYCPNGTGRFKRKLSRQTIERMIAKRQEARRAGNWPAADRLHAFLVANGIRLQDSAHGTLWRRREQQGVVELTR
jgi:cysteinyl-tRNA synthetase